MTEIQVTQSHEEAVREMMVQIRAMVLQRLPGLGGMSASERRRLLNAASVPDDFLEQVAIAIDAAPEVGVANRITSEESRGAIAFSRVYFAFADQLVQLAHDVTATVLAIRHDVGQRALGVYGTVKSVNRPNRRPAVSNAAALRRALGRSGRRRAVAKEPAPPAKTPPADDATGQTA